MDIFDVLREKLDENSQTIEPLYNMPVNVIGLNVAIDIVNQLEQEYNNGWIPCSERLPEDGKDVLVWFEYYRFGEYNRLVQTIGISWIYKGEWSGFVNGSSGWRQLNIIAWQPLPEPYKAEEA